jgi:hypothetical protein
MRFFPGLSPRFKDAAKLDHSNRGVYNRRFAPLRWLPSSSGSSTATKAASAWFGAACLAGASGGSSRSGGMESIPRKSRNQENERISDSSRTLINKGRQRPPKIYPAIDAQDFAGEGLPRAHISARRRGDAATSLSAGQFRAPFLVYCHHGGLGPRLWYYPVFISAQCVEIWMAVRVLIVLH